MESAKKDFTNIYLKVGLVIGLISTIIMMGTIGKIISDSRRETAVFRALGSKRRDIIQIYLTYSLMLAGILIVFVSFISLVLVFWVHKKYSSSLTIESLLTFSSKDFSNKFSLIGLDIGQILALFVFIISGAVFSTIIPLAFNVRRNPINDMRDDR